MPRPDGQFFSVVRAVFGNRAQINLDQPVELVTQPDLWIRAEGDTNPFAGLYADQVVKFTLEAFNSEDDARLAGERWTTSLLWAAISIRAPIEITSGPSGDIIDRTQLRGSVGEVVAIAKNDPIALADEALNLWRAGRPIDPQLRLSLELFAAALLERSSRAKLIGLASAIEPIATPQAYSPAIVGVYDSALGALLDVVREDRAIDEGTRNSIQGRARDLRKESHSQAITRIVRKALPNREDVLTAIKYAYDARSKLAHEGKLGEPTGAIIQNAESAIRQLLAQLLSLPLRVPLPLT